LGGGFWKPNGISYGVRFLLMSNILKKKGLFIIILYCVYAFTNPFSSKGDYLLAPPATIDTFNTLIIGNLPHHLIKLKRLMFPKYYIRAFAVLYNNWEAKGQAKRRMYKKSKYFYRGMRIDLQNLYSLMNRGFRYHDYASKWGGIWVSDSFVQAARYAFKDFDEPLFEVPKGDFYIAIFQIDRRRITKLYSLYRPDHKILEDIPPEALCVHIFDAKRMRFVDKTHLLIPQNQTKLSRLFRKCIRILLKSI